VLFTGTSDHIIDPKQRLSIPAKHRDQVGREQVVWYCVPWPGVGLRLYVDDTFQALAQRADETLTPGPDEADLESMLFPLAERLEMDGQGRVPLPKHLLELAGLRSSEVVILGVRNRLEVRDRAAWKAGLGERFAKMAELVQRVESRRQGG